MNTALNLIRLQFLRVSWQSGRLLACQEVVLCLLELEARVYPSSVYTYGEEITKDRVLYC
jgi:hypothetical protein